MLPNFSAIAYVSGTIVFSVLVPILLKPFSTTLLMICRDILLFKGFIPFYIFLKDYEEEPLW